MTNDLTTVDAGEIMESVIIKGDLARLTPAERSNYYMSVCKSVGLNPLTQPFAYITLNGKLTLYALRACTDQLRQLHGISVQVVERVNVDGLLAVHVRVTDKEGRQDEDFGVVTIGNLKGDAAANAMMKAVTKAKRRATLSLCGLGWLDESEIETIPGARVEPQDDGPATKPPMKMAPKPAAKPAAPAEPPVNPETGEVSPHAIIISSKDGKFDWIGFGKSYLAALKSARNADECQAWEDANTQNLATMAKQAADVHARLTKAVQEQVGWTKDTAAQQAADDTGDII